MSSVRIDGFLRDSGAPGQLRSEAPDVVGLLEELEREYPRLRGKLRDETGEIRRFLRVFVNGEDVRNGDGLATALSAADVVEILPSTPGG